MAGVLVVGLAVLLLWVALLGYQARRHPAVPLPALPELSQTAKPLRVRLTEAHAAVQHPPFAADAVARLARLFHANDFPIEADACWERLMQMEPTVARWAYYRADIARTNGEYERMLALLQRTAGLDAAYAPVWLQLAEHRLKTGELAAARLAYERRLALVNNDPYARFGLARIAQLEGQNTTARQLLAQLASDSPGFAPARNLHAELLAAAGEHEAAARERAAGSEAGRFLAAPDPWLDALMDDCFDYERLCVRGQRDTVTGQWEQARVHLERAASLRPDDLTARELLGNLYLDLGDATKAIGWYAEGRAGASAQPSSAFYVNYARAYRQAARPDEAVRVLTEALTTLGESSALQGALALALAELPDPERARVAFRRACELDPRDPDAAYNHATALLAVERREEALAELQRALELRPTHPLTLSLLAQIEMDSNRWSSALRYLEPLYASQPHAPDARGTMALAYLRAGEEAQARSDPSEAENLFRAGLRVQPDHAELAVRLGLLLLQEQRPAEAIPPLEYYHRAQPARSETVLLLARAYVSAGRFADARRFLEQTLSDDASRFDPSTRQRVQELLRRLPP